MPVSGYHLINPVLRAIDMHMPNPRSILDVGCGFGKFGVLLRERYDIRKNRYEKKDWMTKIDAVEVWAKYITPLHTYVYSNIYSANILTALKWLPHYDVILALEVLEHLPKDEGLTVLYELQARCNKLMVISFPNTFNGREGRDWENPHERHQCLWTQEELNACLDDNVIKLGGTSYCYVR